MANSKKQVTFKNVKVSYSTMLNKEDKCPYGRLFKVLVPMESQEFKDLLDMYKEMNDKAKTHFGETLGKKLKNATSIDDKFQESTFPDEVGFVPLSFNIAPMREKEVENENGEKVKTKAMVQNPVYKNGLKCCMLNNNGEKVYETEKGTKFAPLSKNYVDVTVSLNAKYNSKDNKPSIEVVADEVVIVKSEFGKKASKPEFETLTLYCDEEEVQQETATKTPENEMFEGEELAILDV